MVAHIGPRLARAHTHLVPFSLFDCLPSPPSFHLPLFLSLFLSSLSLSLARALSFSLPSFLPLPLPPRSLPRSLPRRDVGKILEVNGLFAFVIGNVAVHSIT